MSAPGQFSPIARLLHWLMAVMILAMLLIGAGMVTAVSERYHTLVAIHKPLGIAILVLVGIRLLYRVLHPAPPLPDTLSRWQKAAAYASHALLYGLMLALPMIGWAMLSAEPYPIVLFGQLHLPPILAPDATVYAALRRLHAVLAYLLFATFLLHLGAALLHALILRDGVFASMAPGRKRLNRATMAVRQAGALPQTRASGANAAHD